MKKFISKDITGEQLKIAIIDIDKGRFKKVINTFNLGNVCAKCDYFNYSINDKRKRYRCYCIPSCLSATLNPRVISYINCKLGWITKEDHIGGE